MVSGEDFPLDQAIVSVEYLCFFYADVFSAPYFIVLCGCVKTDYDI